MRHAFIALLLLTGALPARAAPALERGAAIIDPAALRELDRGRFGVARLLLPERSSNAPLTDSQLFALPSMRPVRQALDGEFERYVAKHKASLPNETIGVGDGFAFQLFDRALLDSPDTRFVLAGIINRMDRAYVSRADCGEIRLIYRLTQTSEPNIGDNAVSPRLPMTLNLVLKARVEGQKIACSEIARRWLAAGDLTLTGAEIAAKLTTNDGPLALINYANIDRIETNLQIVHALKSPTRDFRTDYLLKAFRLQCADQSMSMESPLENQIDRDREFWPMTLLQARLQERGCSIPNISPRWIAARLLIPPQNSWPPARSRATPVGFDKLGTCSRNSGWYKAMMPTSIPVFTKADDHRRRLLQRAVGA